MRLVNTSTFKFHEFFEDIPLYAILSHRWEAEEVTFQDFQEGHGPNMEGWGKIEACCKQAVRDGWEYAWIDSCCIDKTNSAELSEAINSMFEWYRRAEVCYVYLSDVHCPKSRVNTDRLRWSKWFTRGWTLQELLAPRLVEFYNSSWEEIGTRSSLATSIITITGIDHLFNYDEASVAQKMSWASKRKTSRVEDLAYCLMGLFNIYMPPIYGEGKNAFLRLQQEILKQSDDETIFAWESQLGELVGLLAADPWCFRHARFTMERKYDRQRPPFTMTGKGLRMELFLARPVKKAGASSDSFEYVPVRATLNCKAYEDASAEGLSVEIQLTHPHRVKVSDGPGNETYGWLRDGALFRSTDHPSRQWSKTRAILFMTVSLSERPQIHKRPWSLKLNLSSRLPFTPSMIWPPGIEDSLRKQVDWIEKSLNSYVAHLLPGRNGILGFLSTTVDNSDDGFALLVVGSPFSVHILHDNQLVRLGELLENLDGEKVNQNQLQGEQISKVVCGELVIATVKKQVVEGHYTYVVNLDVGKDGNNGIAM